MNKLFITETIDNIKLNIQQLIIKRTYLHNFHHDIA